MFSLRKKKIKKTVTTQNSLLENPHHEWIREDKVLYRFFKAVLEILSEEDFNKLNKAKQLCFLYSPGKYASTLPSSDRMNFIIAYPDLITLIKSVDNRMAFSIIFHELGHLINEHHKDERPSLIKQIEADNFAIKYGMAKEIFEFLHSQNRSFEVVKRLENLQEHLDNQNLDQ
jgi:hypothetical protein